ncbi:MAG: hypothetical protein IJ763_07105 [Lachnospiraceae bacterium]|nr:hypothetical protein [Lachnospiraceae bacterium]
MNKDESQKAYMIKTIKITLAIVGVILLIGLIFFIRYEYNKYSLQQKIRQNNLNAYMRIMYITATVDNGLFKCDISDIEFNDYNQLVIDVAYYNSNSGNDNVTIEQLVTELQNYASGKGDYSALNTYFKYDIYDDTDYDLYDSIINTYLKKNYNVFYIDATNEQLKEAIDAVDGGWGYPDWDN